MSERFLPVMPGAEIESILNAAPGNEIGTGKFDSQASSAALAVNGLFYLYAEPETRPENGEDADDRAKARHRNEFETFDAVVAGDGVDFVSCSWRRLLDVWTDQPDGSIRKRARAVTAHFFP